AAGGSLAGLGYGQLQIYNSNQGNLSPREVWTGQGERKFFGVSIANLGDEDGDGWPSLAVGAPLEGATQGGCVFVGEADGVNKTASGLPAMCGPDYASAGSVLAAVGDVDGDGLEDLLVGSNPDYRYATRPQVVWLITAPIAGNLADVAAASWDWESTSEGEGSVVAGAGDVDADGHMDLLVGAPADRAVGYGVGAAFLIVGNPSGAGSLASADAKILGSGTTFMWLGTSVAAAPDIDGDSLTDLAVGANNADDNGASSGTVFLLSGTVRGTVPARGTAHTWLMGEAGDAAGHGVGQADDQDGDGLSELWVSSTTYGLGSGAVWGLSLAGPP
ncbi:MAG TPA: FG-GAP-like repeat-containing protein, partial [Myxococcota bacterium]|nr:FG-GAP-like repeat-containing protein [Myxococcota bacterium]